MPKPPSGNVRVNVFLTNKTLRALKMLANRRGTSYSELVRTACHEYVIREKEKLA